MSRELNVLIVEDSEDDARLVVLELERGGYRVSYRQVDTASEMKAALEDRFWDLVISDFNVPGFGGMEALSAMKESGLDLPFLIVSGTVGEEIAVTAMKTGAHDYLMKGRLARLVPAVERELREAAVRQKHRQTLDALKASNQKLQAMVRASPLAIVAFHADWTVSMWNPAAERMFGWKEDEVLGRRYPLIPDEGWEQALRDFRPIFEGSSVSAIETKTRRKDNSLVDVVISGAALRDSSGISGAMAVIADITERKMLEAQLRQAQKLEAVGRLAGGIAHDFNNIITVIMGYSELVRSQLPSDDALLDDVEAIRGAGERAAALTRQLLAFSRQQVYSPQVLDLADIVHSFHSMLKRLVGEDVQLETEVGPDLWHVKADRSQIEQVVMNLVVNARDAMPNGGRLRIKMANEEVDETYARLHPPLASGRYVVLSVSDTGFGMDEVTKARIFEPFFTTKEPGKGTGLGLSTVYGIVKQSSGCVLVDSEVGHGTTFRVYLPPVAEEPITRDVAVPVGRLHGNESILLVEDEVELRRLVHSILENHGYSVVQASRSEEALCVLDGDAKIDLLLTDVFMPDVSGVQLAQRARERHRDMKVCYMSGFTEHHVIKTSVLEPGAHFVQKPFTPHALLQKVREALNEPPQARV